MNSLPANNVLLVDGQISSTTHDQSETWGDLSVELLYCHRAEEKNLWFPKKPCVALGRAIPQVL